MECSFCHGSNSDQSRFCSTCGRRLLTVGGTEQNPSERPTLGKLHSPLLSGRYEDEISDYDSPTFPKGRQIERLSPSFLRNSTSQPPPITEGSIQNVAGKENKLHSPLLEPANQALPVALPEIKPREEEYDALRSPLLSTPVFLSHPPSITPDTPIAPPPSAKPVVSAPATAPPTPAATSSALTPTAPRTPATTSSALTPTAPPTPAAVSSALTPAAPPTPAPPSSSGTSTSQSVLRNSAIPKTPIPPAPPATTSSSPLLRPSTPSLRQKQYELNDSSRIRLDSAIGSSGRSYAGLVLLTIAALLKIWFINQYWGQQIIVIDQVAQLLVIVSVAGLCLAPPGNKPGNKQQ